MKNLTTALLSLVILASSTAFAGEPQLGKQICHNKIMAMAMMRMRTKINNTKSLSNIKDALAANNGDLAKVLNLSGASVVEMGQYVGENQEQQMAYVSVNVDPKIAWVALSVGLTVNDACTVIKMDNAKAASITYEDGSVSGE